MIIRLIFLFITLFSSSCVYKYGIKQGYLITEKELSSLRTAMPRQDLYAILGNPSFKVNDSLIYYLFKKEDSDNVFRILNNVSLSSGKLNVLEITLIDDRVKKINIQVNDFEVE
jgi:outer membrane protein assembly factor BamE (lipoprotein component of BamABCDE complex)